MRERTGQADGGISYFVKGAVLGTSKCSVGGLIVVGVIMMLIIYHLAQN